MTNCTALILRATGGVGGKTAAALERRDSRIRALARKPGEARNRPVGVSWNLLQSDGRTPADVVKAADVVDVIVHAANPPRYRIWVTTVLPMFENVMAAEAADARALLRREDEVPPYATFNFACFRDADGVTMTDAIKRAAGDPTIGDKAFPWALMRVLALRLGL